MRLFDKYCWLAFGLVLVTFLVLYYFWGTTFVVRDDNVNYLLPQLKLQGDILFHSHQIPQMNFYSYLGHPLIGQAQTGVLYLPRYVFYLVASWFNNFELILTLEAFFHILLACISMYVFLFYLSVEKEYRVLGSYAYACNGFLIEIGRNWLAVIDYYAYLPLLYLCTLKVARRPTLRVLIFFSLLRVVLFYIGHINFFVYIIFFEILLFVFSCRDRKYYLQYVVSHLLSFIGYLPLFLPLARVVFVSARGELNEQFTASVSFLQVLGSFVAFPCKEFIFKQTCSSFGYFNLLAPLFFVSVLLFVRRSTPKKILNSMYAFELRKILERVWKPTSRVKYLVFVLAVLFILVTKGAILVDLCILLILYIALRKKKLNENGSIAIWVLLFLLSIAFSFGVKSIFTYFALPIVVPFRWPFKWYLLAQFFLVVWATLSLSKLLDIKKIFLPFMVFNLIIVVLGSVIFSEYNNLLYKPYSAISDRSYISLLDSRYVSVSNWQTIGSLTMVLADNAGAYFEKFSFGGYDPLVSSKKKDLTSTDHYNPVVETRERYLLLKDTLNAYGVKYFIVDNNSLDTAAYVHSDPFEYVDSNKGVTIFKNNAAEPMVQGDAGNSLPFSVAGNSLVVQIPEATSKVTLGFLNEDSNWRASLNGTLLQVNKDLFGRLVVPVSNKSGVLKVEYVDQLFFLGLILSVAGYIVSFFAIRIMLSKRVI